MPISLSISQRVALGDAFPQPLVVRAFDGQGNALPNAVVSFAVSGPAWVLPATPITTDANGYAQVNAAAVESRGKTQAIHMASNRRGRLQRRTAEVAAV